MQKLFKILLPLGVLAFAGGAAYWMIISKPEPQKRERPSRPMLVRAMETELQDIVFKVETQGNVSTHTETVLVPEVSGKIIWVSPSWHAGGFFKEGDTLLKIDPSDYEVQVAQARATLERARVTYSLEQAQAELARKDWDELGEGEPSDLVLRKPQLREAEANIQSAEAALARALRDLERTNINAPYDGMVREKRADLGQVVGGNTPLADIFAVDYAEVRLPLSSRDIAYLELPAQFGEDQEGPQVYLKADYAGTEYIWEARIVRTEGTVNTRSRLMYAVARVEDPYNIRAENSQRPPLLIGQFTHAIIMGIKAEDIVIIPRHALSPENTVLVVDDENKIDVREVEVLRADSENAYIGDGLTGNEVVTLSSLSYVVDGMPVRTYVENASGQGQVTESGPAIRTPREGRPGRPGGRQGGRPDGQGGRPGGRPSATGGQQSEVSSQDIVEQPAVKSADANRPNRPDKS